MAMRLQSAPSIQSLNKDCLHTTRTTHQQNDLLVRRCVALIRIAALYKNQVHTYIHTYITRSYHLAYIFCIKCRMIISVIKCFQLHVWTIQMYHIVMTWQHSTVTRRVTERIAARAAVGC